MDKLFDGMLVLLVVCFVDEYEFLENDLEEIRVLLDRRRIDDVI